MKHDKAMPMEKPAAAEAGTLSGSRRRLSSAELLGAAREIVIEHGGDEYRLRVTSNGKLILTK